MLNLRRTIRVSIVLQACMMCAVVASAGLAQEQVDDGARREESVPLRADELTDTHIRLAIRAMVDELYARRDAEKFWEPARYDSSVDAGQAGGFTALAVLALLYAGESYQEPRLREAVAYLENLGLNGTYATGVRAHVWGMLPERFRKQLELDARWLVEGFSERVGGWNYGKEPQTARQDNSVTQYGALGLWEASKRGVNVPARLWQLLEERFVTMQVADGGWNYDGTGPTTGSMTTAGLAVLFITQDFLHANAYLDVGERKPRQAEQAMKLGMEWMDANFSATENPGRDTDFYYYLYGVERVGMASGYKFFAGRDWYREGAAELLRRLCRWDGDAGTMTMHQRIAGKSRAGEVRTVDLCFAMMFLSRGRVPVGINKLRAEGLEWNNRPRDVANLTHWMASHAESLLNWQIVDVTGDPRTWLDAPILYFASHHAIPWQAGSAELEKLRTYLDFGGLLFAVNESKVDAFAQSIEQAGAALYSDYKWRTLEADHWAYSMLWPVRDKKPALRALSNGVRELIILCPGDDVPQSFQRRADDRAAHFHTAGNIYLYASEMNRPRARLDRHSPVEISGGEAKRRVQIVVARHAGNWRAEPKALTLFQWSMAARGVDVEIVEAPLDAIHTLDTGPALAMVSGVDSLEFTPAQIDAITAYVESGGTVLFETPGGRGAFTVSAEAMAARTFEKPIRALLRSAIISGEALEGGKEMSRVDYRPFAFEHFGARETSPRLRAMTIDGEPRLLFSREDISHALLDQPCWGVSGYAPASARDLLCNIVLHAQKLRDAAPAE
jgi:hypothetical protein